MTLGPSPAALEALTRDLRAVLATEGGCTPVQASRRLQLRTSVMWQVLAPLLESGEVVVRAGGLHLAASDPWRRPRPATAQPAV